MFTTTNRYRKLAFICARDLLNASNEKTALPKHSFYCVQRISRLLPIARSYAKKSRKTNANAIVSENKKRLIRELKQRGSSSSAKTETGSTTHASVAETAGKESIIDSVSNGSEFARLQVTSEGTNVVTNGNWNKENTGSIWKAIASITATAGIAYAMLRQSESAMASDIEFFAFDLIAPLFSRALDAERAHNAGVALFEFGIYPIERRERNERKNRNNSDDGNDTRTSTDENGTYYYREMREALEVKNLFGKGFTKTFPNPIGLAAGFDKDAKAIEAMREIGFGFVEIGSVTPKPQDGNPKPRVFRLRELQAVINRYGFNSEGFDRAKERLDKEKKRVDTLLEKSDDGIVVAPVGVNLGKNKTTPESEAAKSYALGAKELGPYADYLVINVSSPNTPGLRDLQKGSSLFKIMREVVEQRDKITKENKKPNTSLPVLVKIAPDVDVKGLKEIAKAVKKAKIDGVIISNTTIERNEKVREHANGTEVGGLSGKPVFEKSTDVLSQFYVLTNGEIPLIGCGGVFTGEDALKKIKAGASLVQLYTSFAYDGPGLVPRVKRELFEALKKEGFKNVSEAVGYDHRKEKSATTTSSWRFLPTSAGYYFPYPTSSGKNYNNE